MALQGFDNEYLFVNSEEVQQRFRKSPILRNLYITDIGYFPNARNHFVQREKGVPQWVMIFCTGGKGTAICDGHQYNLSRYSLIILPPNKRHIYFADHDQPWDIYWVHFRGSLARQYDCVNDNVRFFLKLPAEEINSFMRNFWLMIRAFLAGSSRRQAVYCSQLLGVLLSELSYNFNNYIASTTGDSYVNDAINYIYHHLDEPISINDIANELKISRSYLTRLFKESKSMGINQYVIKAKMQQASLYLQYTNLLLNQISRKVGYSDYYYFSKVFKKEIHCSPREFRQKYQGAI